MAAASSSSSKVIALIDMDCFECQIWQRMYPEYPYWNTPCVVADETGRISSVNYKARDLGISRKNRVREAKRLAYKEKAALHVFTKPNDREKPDGKTVRFSSWEIVDALKEYCHSFAYGVILEYGSMDEFYLDITEEVDICMASPSDYPDIVESQTFLEGKHQRIEGNLLKFRLKNVYPLDRKLVDEERLVCGGLLMQELNNFIFSKTKFAASIGIGKNKLMAKLACGLNKPNGITIFPNSALPRVGKKIKLASVPGFGGKLGLKIQDIFEANTMDDLANIPFEDLENSGIEFTKAFEAFCKSRGEFDEPVIEKLFTDEVSCGKNFQNQISSNETIHYHLFKLSEEMIERLEEERFRHLRHPTSFRIHISYAYKDAPEDIYNAGETFPNEYIGTEAELCDIALNCVLKIVQDNIDIMTVTRLCLTAKAFISVN